jgi:hypothetical protein
VTSVGHTCGLQHIRGKRRFQNIFEVQFSDLYGYWRTRLFSVSMTLEDKVVLIFW